VTSINKTDIINNLIKLNNGFFDTAQAVQAGVSKTMLGQLVKNGIIERAAHGLYTDANIFPDELFILQQRTEKIIYSHETALFLHNLSERTPILHTLTVPSDKKLSPSLANGCKIYYIKPELHGMGICTLPSKMGHEITVYNIERTICDVFRSRNRMDNQTVAEAIKGYASRNDINWNLLSEYARIFSVTKLMRQYLEVLT
jgi:predicted transcriptional regulator of viral defense system